VTSFEDEVRRNVEAQGRDAALRDLTKAWIRATLPHKYSYAFTWLGRPVIQMPQDLVALQEILWRVRPDLVVETGIAHGGSLVFHASMLELLGGDGLVVGIDVDIRKQNREALERHPLARRLHLIQGSSVAPEVVAEVRRLAEGRERVLVLLDSNHTHDHVLRELEAYSPLVTKGSYLIVYDTLIDDLPADGFPDRPWGPGNNPKTAVHAFLATTDRFVIDRSIEDKILITVAPDGYLACVRAVEE
jgi:cephalosporin hydroxylase